MTPNKSLKLTACQQSCAGGLKAADEHYKWLSQKFGYSIPTPEGLVNQIGYQ